MEARRGQTRVSFAYASGLDAQPRKTHILKIKGKDTRPDPSGQPMTGRILRIAHGGHGGIRAAGYRDVFFHRADAEGKFNTLEVGDEVTFELLEDCISGARAIRVRKKRLRRGEAQGALPPAAP